MSTAIITWVTDPADGGGGTAVRIKIDARVSVASKRGGCRWTLTNRDGCSYSEVPVDSNGMISVDFVMKPLQTDVKLTERVKFHA